MKKFLALLLISGSILACSKDSSTTTTPTNTTPDDSIKYVVKTTNAQNWSGYYLDENNQKITITNQGPEWSVTFKNKAAKPRDLIISATTVGVSDTGRFTVESQIYADGSFIGYYFIKGTGNKAETALSRATLD